jgi:hypothetical protein
MHSETSNRGYLSPCDLKLCHRVLEKLCTEGGVDPNSLAAETLASDVLVTFQHGTKDEQALFDSMVAKTSSGAIKSASEAITDTRRVIRESRQLLDWLNNR